LYFIFSPLPHTSNISQTFPIRYLYFFSSLRDLSFFWTLRFFFLNFFLLSPIIHLTFFFSHFKKTLQMLIREHSKSSCHLRLWYIIFFTLKQPTIETTQSNIIKFIVTRHTYTLTRWSKEIMSCRLWIKKSEQGKLFFWFLRFY
jgi:hypothetical protein